MKGLLIKDYYMTVRYCRTMLLVVIAFLAVSLVNESNWFFSIYPCLLCGMIPSTLLAYDERSRWNEYAAALPYTRAQLVGEKYLMGLILVAAATAVSVAAMAVRSLTGHSGSMPGLLTVGGFMMGVGLTGSALCLPWMFRFGVEKGRMMYYAVVALFFGGSAVFAKVTADSGITEIPAGAGLAVLAAAAALYAASCALSVALYRKREL